MGAIGMGSGRSRDFIERGGGGGRNGSSVRTTPPPTTADDIVDDVPKPKGFLRNLSKSQKYGLGAAAAVVAGLAYEKQKQSVDQRFR